MKAETTHADRETDVLFDLLSSPRRRTILQVLHEHGDDIDDISSLADHVAVREADKSLDHLTTPGRKRVYVSLYQTNLPKLADAGVITYDADTGTIEATTRLSRFAPYFGWPTRPHTLTPATYGVLATISGLFLTGTMLNISVLGAIPKFIAGLAIIIAFIALTITLRLLNPDTRLEIANDA